MFGRPTLAEVRLRGPIVPRRRGGNAGTPVQTYGGVRRYGDGQRQAKGLYTRYLFGYLRRPRTLSEYPPVASGGAMDRGRMLGLAVVVAWIVGQAVGGRGFPWAALHAAEEFRVENKVYVGSEKEPRSESTTIFYQGLVYDYLKEPAEVTVFDAPHRRFVLLDTSRRLKTELSADEVAALNHNLRDWAAGQADPYLQFLAAPKFEEQFDEPSATLTLTSPWVSYRVVTEVPDNPAIARQYREFSDWYTLLNTRLNPGSKLPFARLSLNESLDKRGRIPKEVSLTMRSKRGLPFQKITVRSEHHLVPTLLQSDRDRIRQTDEFIGMFRMVDFGEYQRPSR